jgi:hypothetical protein
LLITKAKNALRRLSTSDLIYFEEQFMYGHREILLNYCMQSSSNLNNFSILEGSIDHGFAIQENIWRLRKRNLTRAKRYVWNDRAKSAYGEDSSVFATGSPWLYLLSDLGLTPLNIGTKIKKNPKKVVIFPGHNVDTYFKYNIETIRQHFLPFVPEESQVTVCLFWTDFCDPSVRRKFTELGWNVESMGYVPRVPNPDSIQGGRPNFLLELFNLFIDTRLIITDNASTGLLYALTLDTEVMYVPSIQIKEHESIGNSLLGLDDNRPTGFFSTEIAWVSNYLPSLFETKTSPTKFLDFAWSELGYDNFLKNKSGGKFEWINSNVHPNALSLYRSRLESIVNFHGLHNTKL